MLMAPLMLLLPAVQAVPVESPKVPVLSLVLKDLPPGDRVELDVRVVHEVVDLGRTLAAGRTAPAEADRVLRQVGTPRWRVQLEAGKQDTATFQPVFTQALTSAQIPRLSMLRLEGSLRVFRGFQLVRTLEALPIVLCQGQVQVVWELVHEGQGPRGPRYACTLRSDAPAGPVIPGTGKPPQS